MTNVTVELTEKQESILASISKGNPDGSPLDLDELIDKVNYTVTKQALQFSLRRMIKRALIKKIDTEVRRGRRRAVFSPTNLGLETYRQMALKTT